MNKKVMIGICLIAVFMVIILVVRTKKEKLDDATGNSGSVEEIHVSDIVQDEETGEYVIYDKETGEELARSEDKGSLYIYTIDPDYNPRPPENSDVDEIIEME